MDWLLRRRSTAEPPKVGPPDLQPIRLYAADAVVAGWVHPAGERITDLLQRREELLVLPEGANQDDPDAWRSLDSDLLLLVVPPPHVSPPELRVHRQREAVLVRIGPYAVTGTAHLKPGEEEDLFFRATHPFLPLTDAVIERPDAPPERHDVVIVNLRLVEEFREID